MLPCVRALMSQVIDYAGLFPPAKLPMEPAIRNLTRYMSEPESWMLGRFICPAARLEELNPFMASLFFPVSPLTISALGRGGATPADFLEGLRQDLEAMARFRQTHGPRVIIDAFEVKLPAAAAASDGVAPLLELLDQTAELIETSSPQPLNVSYEAGFGPGGRQTIDGIVQALAEADQRNRGLRRQKYEGHGFKLRCGGVEASAFPSAEQIAWVLTACARQRLPLKFTAGLHHPIRHFAESVQTHMHGFINVLLAAALAMEEKWEVEPLTELLLVDQADAFHPTSEGWIWRKYLLPTDMISVVRSRFGLSFGSCSFDEPREDLRALGWL